MTASDQLLTTGSELDLQISALRFPNQSPRASCTQEGAPDKHGAGAFELADTHWNTGITNGLVSDTRIVHSISGVKLKRN